METTVTIFRALDTLSPQTARHPRTLPDIGKESVLLANTVLDPRQLKLGGYVDLTHISPEGISPAGIPSVRYRVLPVPRHIALQGDRRQETIILSPLQSAFNELVKVAYDPDQGFTKAQLQQSIEQMLGNLLDIAAGEFRKTALSEVVRFRVPGALKVCVADDRLRAEEIGISQKSMSRLFGRHRGLDTVALVGRYPTFCYLPARVIALHDVGDAVAVSPEWFVMPGETEPRTFLDRLEGDCDGDLLSVIPAPNARCAKEIEEKLSGWKVISHADMSIPMPALSDLHKVTGDHFTCAMAKYAGKEYIASIITLLYQSWITYTLCERDGVEIGLSRQDITEFWKAVSEGVFDLKHRRDAMDAAEAILLAYRGERRYEEIVEHIRRIEKMPPGGSDVGRLIWEMPRKLGQALGKPLVGGEMAQAAGLCKTWSLMQGDPIHADQLSGIKALSNGNLGQSMLCDIYGL